MTLDDQGVEVLGLLLVEAVDTKVIEDKQVRRQVAAKLRVVAVVGARLVELTQKQVGTAEEHAVTGADGSRPQSVL